MFFADRFEPFVACLRAGTDLCCKMLEPRIFLRPVSVLDILPSFDNNTGQQHYIFVHLYISSNYKVNNFCRNDVFTFYG